MTHKLWLIIKDDSKRTFEVIGQAGNENSLVNKTYAMQRVGMNVSCVTPPITSNNASKGLVKITGYLAESGLYDRLQKQYSELLRQSSFEDEDDA